MAVIVSLIIKSPKEEDNDVIEENDCAMYMKQRADEVLDSSSLLGNTDIVTIIQLTYYKIYGKGKPFHALTIRKPT